MNADREKASRLWLLGDAFAGDTGVTGAPREDEAGLTACVTCGAPAESFHIASVTYAPAPGSLQWDTPSELELLREVHEAARQYLRYRGIDKERQDAALVRMVDATEAVKDYDATN